MYPPQIREYCCTELWKSRRPGQVVGRAHWIPRTVQDGYGWEDTFRLGGQNLGLGVRVWTGVWRSLFNCLERRGNVLLLRASQTAQTRAPRQGLAAVTSLSSWIPVTIFKPLVLHTMAADIMRPWSVSCLSKYGFGQTMDHL